MFLLTMIFVFSRYRIVPCLKQGCQQNDLTFETLLTHFGLNHKPLNTVDVKPNVAAEVKYKAYEPLLLTPFYGGQDYRLHR